MIEKNSKASGFSIFLVAATLKVSSRKEGIAMIQDPSQEIRAVTKQLEQQARRREQLEARLTAARKKIHKAESYHNIMNLMSAHVHCCLNQDYETELDTYWSKRDDIVYANGDLAYVGQTAVRKYYVEAGKRRSKARRTQLSSPCSAGEKTPGYINMNLIGTPYIEIAEDGQTARGIWMAHSFQGYVDNQGTLKTQGVLSRYSGEFILEEGQWKIWHRRNYADVVFEENPAAMMRPAASDGGKPPKPLVENPKPTTLTRIKVPDNRYSACSVPSGFPDLPAPYDTWTYETSNVQKDGEYT